MADIIELGRRIKAKVPGAYDDLSDEALGAKIRSKFPVYRDFTDVLPPGAELTGLPGISKPDVGMRESGFLDKASEVGRSAVNITDTFLRSGNRAVSQSVQGVGGATEALGGYLERTAKDQGKQGLVGGPIKQLGKEIRGFGEGMGRGGEVREDMRGVAGENFLEKPEVLANPEYYADLAGQISGSMLSMMAPTGAAIGQADKAMQLLKIKQQYLPLVRTAIGVSTSSMVETLFDAGNSYKEALDMGASEETAQAVVAETFKRELPPTLAFNAFGLFNDMMKGGVKKFALSSLSEGLQEASQGIAQRQSFGLVRPQTDQDVYGPAPFEAIVGAMGGAFGEGVMNRVGETKAPSGGTNPVIPETIATDDDPDGPGGGTPAEKPYTPEQYAKALDLTMQREKNASPSEISKAVGTDSKATQAMLQQMQDEGYVQKQGPKDRKSWKIIKQPGTQAATAPSGGEEVQLDPLRPNVYQGDSQEIPAYQSPLGGKEVQLNPLRPNVYRGESQEIPSSPMPVDRASNPSDLNRLDVDEQKDGSWRVQKLADGTPSNIPTPQVATAPSDATSTAPASQQPTQPEEDVEVLPDGTRVRTKKKLLVPTRAGLEVVDSKTGAVEMAGEAKGDGTERLISSIQGSLSRNQPIGDIKKVMARVEAETGLSAARGEIEAKEAYDIIEVAVNRIVAEQGAAAMKPGADFRKGLAGLRAMMTLLPTQSSRSETQVKFQQFSTPPTLAYLAAKLAAMTSEDTVLEPSAGTGGLASWAKATGATVHTNEIDPKRAALLERQGYTVTRENAEQIHNILPDSVKPTVVLMNPPFSAAGTRGTNNSNSVGYQHVEQAFERLEPGGRLVVILGEGATLDAPTAQPFWQRMAAKGKIRANIGIDGKEYAKYGTTFGNRTVVIDKTGPTPGANWLKQRANIVKGDFKTIEEAWDAVKDIAADRSESSSPSTGGQTGTGSGSVRGDSAQPESNAGGQSAPATKRPGATDGRVSGINAAPSVLPDIAKTGSEGATGKLAGVQHEQPVDGKSGAELSAVADDAVPPVRPVVVPSAPAPKPAPAPAPKQDEKPADSAVAFKPPTEAEIDAKHGELLAEAAAAARERLKKKMQGTQLNSGFDPQDLLDLATIAAEKMRQHGIAFKKWSEPFIKEMGEWLREHIQAIRDRAEEVYDSLREKAIRVLSQPQSPATKDGDRTDDALNGVGINTGRPPTAEAAPAPSAKGEDDGGNVLYVPSKLPKHWGAQPHPGRIVETQSMAATDEPDIVMKPNIPWNIVERGDVSEVQLVAVSLAIQSHERFLGDGSRQGFFVGDGTGSGKGITTAATILHHWNNGVKRIIYVSAKGDLIEDTKKYLADLDATIPLISINKFKKGTAIEPKFKEGIVFVAYTTLAQATPNVTKATKQQAGSKEDDATPTDFYRVQQLREWAGDDSMIVFDEAHKAKNAIVAQGGGMRKVGASGAGKAVLAIQTQMKKARVLYASATGFTDPTNLGYAVRLGLWGEGTSFPAFNAFNAAIQAGGVGAMEMLARDMKAQGKYVSRFLSYAGVDFSETIHALSPGQIEAFEAAGTAWRAVLENLNEALGITGGDKNFQAKAAISQFWAANQRFYRTVLTAMKIPSLFKEMDEALANDQSVIVSIMGTGAAATDRALTQMLNEEDGNLDDLDVSPTEILKQYVEKSFPIHQYEAFVDELGNESSRIARDSEGNPVINKVAEAKKEAILKDLDSLRMPEAALDQIINRYGADKVAEMTGRTNRIVVGEDGNKALEKRKGEAGNSVNVEEARRFQAGEKRIAIISSAASTGISLHADKRAKNQQRRVHIILELKWSADEQMQDFGRSHRTNEASQPEYKLMSVNVGADKRFSSSIARRLEQLGALSRGDRGSSGAGDIAKYNFESVYGRAAVIEVIRNMKRNDTEALIMMGLATQKQSAKDEIPVPQFLNRLLSLPLELQNRIFDQFMDAFAGAIEKAKASGVFDQGAERIKADKLEMSAQPQVVHTDSATGARAIHYQVEAQHKRARVDWESAQEEVRAGFRLMKQKTSGRLIAVPRVAFSNTTDPSTGAVVEKFRFLAASGPGGVDANELSEKYEVVPADRAARDAWDQQYTDAGPYRTEHIHLIGGSVLPIYDRLAESGTAFKVEIAVMPDKTRILGVRIKSSRIRQVLRSLGVGATVSAADVYKGTLDGEKFVLASDVRVHKIVRAGQPRIEVTTTEATRARVWATIQPYGGYVEEIQWNKRYFIPVNDQGIEAMQQLLNVFPVVGDSKGELAMAESKADLPDKSETLYARKVSLESLAGDWVYKARPKESSRETSVKYPAERLLAEADSVLIRAEGDRPASLVATWQVMEIIRIATGAVRFAGAVIETLEAYATVNQLSSYMMDDSLSVAAVENAMRVREQILEAMEANQDRGFVFLLRDTDTAMAEKTSFAETVREEFTHWEQLKLQDGLDNHIDTGPLVNHPLWSRISAYLVKHDYGGSSEAVQVIEAAAKIAAGQRVNMLLSKRQAAEWLDLYLQLLEQRHGDRASNVLRWARKDIQDVNNTTEARQIRRSGRVSSSNESEAKSGTQGKPDSDDGSLFSRRESGLSRRMEQDLSQRQTLYARQGGTTQSRTFQQVLEKSEVRLLREKKKSTDTPDAEYRRILAAVSGQTGTKQLTKDQAKHVFDRLATASLPVTHQLRSPSRVLSRSDAGTQIYKSAEENWFLQERLNERWSKNWDKANKGLNKAEKNRIALYRFVSQITQMRDAESAREWLDSVGEDTSIVDDIEGFLTPKEKEANEKWSKLFFEPSRKMGISEGLIDGKQQFDNYLSFYHDSTLRMNRKKIKDAAADLAHELGIPVHLAEQILEKANPKKVSFGSFDFTRQEWSIPGLRDADTIAEIYRKGFARKIAVSRFLAEANPLTKRIVDPAMRLYARRYIAQYAGAPRSNQVMTNAAWDALMSKIPGLRTLNPSAGQMAGWVTALQYNAKIGFNLFTPLLNLTQTVLNTMPYAGTLRTLSVLPRAMAVVALPNKLNPFVRDIARLHRGGIFADDPGQSKFDRPVLHGVAGNVQRAASYLFDKAESLNRATSYLAGLDMAKVEGLQGEAAVRRAREVVRVTQFYSGRLDAPLFARTPGGKVLMQFKTFTIKQLEFIGQLDRQQQAKFALWTVALGGPASLLLVQAFKTFFPDWEITEWMENWQENWNVAAWLQAGRLQYQMGVFTIPGLEEAGGGRLRDRIGNWLMGPTISSALDLADQSVKTLKDPSRFDKWAESFVRGWVPGGIEAIRVRKAMEEAETAEEALKILTGTEKR